MSMMFKSTHILPRFLRALFTRTHLTSPSHILRSWFCQRLDRDMIVWLFVATSTQYDVLHRFQCWHTHTLFIITHPFFFYFIYLIYFALFYHDFWQALCFLLARNLPSLPPKKNNINTWSYLIFTHKIIVDVTVFLKW